MQKMYKGVLTLALFGVMMVPVSQAKAQTIDEMLKMIQMLTAQIQTLQSQLDGLNEQVLSITENPTLGAEGEDVTVIQELLASDPTLYPEGKVTGYYGPLTSEAIKRFQARQNLPPTGVVDDVTETILNGYLMDLGSIHVDDAAEIPMGYLGDIKRVRKVSTDLLAENCKTLEGETEDHLCKVLSDAFDDHMRSLDIDEDGIKEDFEQEVDDLIRDRFKNAFNHSDDEDSNDSSDEDVTEDDTANDDVEVVELTPADKASEAVSDAQREISDAEDALDGADGDTTVAEDLISDAKTALSKAQRAKRNKNFESAVTNAKEARNLATKALRALN